MPQTRFVVALAVAVAVILGQSPSALAHTYPDRPVRILIAFPAGGSIDTLGRIVAQKLSEAWGQNVVIENRPGAGGNIGAAAAAQAAPDGYSLHFGAQTLGVNVTIAPYQNFDPVRDFEPIILAGTATDVLVVPVSSPFQTLRQLIDYAKDRPGELNYCSLGVGTSSHLSTVQFSGITGVKLQHVPYTGFAQATTDLVAGRIALWIPTLGGSIGNIQGGKMRALAISGARGGVAQRSDVRGTGFRIRRVLLVRDVRAQGHAEGHHRQGQPRYRARAGAAGREGERCHARLPLRRRAARKARRVSQERDRQVGRRGEARRVQVIDLISL